MVVRLSNLRQAAGSHLERQASSLLKLPPEVACKACLGRLSFWFLLGNRWFCGCLEFPFSAFYFLPSSFCFRLSRRVPHTPGLRVGILTLPISPFCFLVSNFQLRLFAFVAQPILAARFSPEPLPVFAVCPIRRSCVWDFDSSYLPFPLSAF